MSTTFQVKHPGMPLKWSRCSAAECGARILWVETANGRKMCLDDFPSDLFASAGDLVSCSSDLTHWSTCVARASFVRPRK